MALFTMAVLRIFVHKVFDTNFNFSKGQIKPKADWRAIDSPKKMNERICFFAINLKYFRTVKHKKTNSFVRFLEESMARQSAFGFI